MLRSPTQLWVAATCTLTPVAVALPQMLAGTVKVELRPGSGPSGIIAAQLVPPEPEQVV